MRPLRIPTAYRTGYREALAIDLDTAYNYVAHTHVGDPVMDAVVEDLAAIPQRQVHEFIQAGMENDPERLLARTPEWDQDAWGVPISAAHMGYAMAVFAARTVKHSISLGARYSAEERASIHAVGQYAGYLMGIHPPGPSFSPNENHAW